MSQRLENLMTQVRDKYQNGDPGHDWAHVMRVMESCRKLGNLVGADLEILLPAALLHDLVNLPKNHPDRSRASAQAAQASRIYLENSDYDAGEIERIGVVITEHSFSLGRKPSCVESAVLQDADRLDALGAIGIMRTVTCGCRMGARYYDALDPFGRGRELDDTKHTLDHFFTKLLKLRDGFNTEPALAEAGQRTHFMRKFLEQLGSEIGSEFHA